MIGNIRHSAGFTLTLLGLFVSLLVCAVPAYADRYSSSSYTIDASVMNTFGGSGGSTNYGLVSSAGEAIVGNGAGGSYKLGQGYIAQLEKALQMTVQPNNQVAYYPFDEGTGTLVGDNTANAYNGTMGSTSTWVAGKIGQALTYDGSNNPTVVGDVSGLDFGASDFTIEAWVKPASLPGTADVLGKWEDGVGGFSLSTVGTKAVVFIKSTSNYRYCAGDLATGTWSHVAFVKTSTTNLDCYLNGSLSNGALGGSILSDVGDTTQPFWLGKGRYATNYDGTLDEAKFFNRAFTASEVKAEYDGQNAGNPAGISLNTIVPGVSQTVNFDTIVDTDSFNYSLAINQNQPLTNGGNTIPAISGSIASPAAWSEGTTKGLGFTLVSGASIPGGWASGANYAAIPGSSTSFYTRSGGTGGRETLGMRLRADVNNTQVSGAYTNAMTITGTIIP